LSETSDHLNSNVSYITSLIAAVILTAIEKKLRRLEEKMIKKKLKQEIIK
jgi:hypothetical protein